MGHNPSYSDLTARVRELEQIAAARRNEDRKLAEELRRFRMLYELALSMAADQGLDHNLNLVVEKSRDLSGTDMAFVALKDEASDEMYYAAASGLRTTAFRNLRFPLKGTLGERVFQSDQGIVVSDYEKEIQLLPPTRKVVHDEGLVSGMAVPVKMGHTMLGALYVFNRHSTEYPIEGIEPLTLIGNMAAMEIHRQRIRQDLEHLHQELGHRVEERTSQLSETNARLWQEIQEREKAESALRQSEERFREMARHIREVFWLMDWRKQRMIYVSPAYEQIWGRPMEDLYRNSRKWEESIHPEDLAYAKGSFRRMLETGGDKTRAYRIIRPDGTVRWVSDRGFAIRDEAGEVIRIAGITEDITERRAVEEENRKRQKYLESVLSHAPDAIVTLDPMHRVIDWNPGAVRMFGYSAAEASGKQLDELVAPGMAKTEASAKTLQVLAGHEVASFETVRHRKDGSSLHVIAAGAPIIVDDTLAGVVAVYTDITALKQVEQALRESEEQMRAVFHTIPDPVTLVRLDDDVCVDVNEAFVEVTGYTRDEVIGKTAESIGIWSDPKDREKLIHVLLEEGEVRNLATRFRRKEGTLLYGLMSARRLTLNECPHFISITRDISALRAAEAEKRKLEIQLHQSQKMEAIGTLAGGIAHDFNNLLMGIQGRSSLMRADITPEHPFYEHLRETEEYVRRASDLTKQLLGFARGGKYEVKPLHLNEVVAGSLSLFGRTRKEIKIRTRYEKQVWTVKADRSQIEQVLLNLFVNAAQAMPEGGELDVQTKNVVPDQPLLDLLGLEPGHFVKISVTDTGVGMDDDVRERIFEPFFTTKVMGRGTGLGLASAYGIIKNHAGTIDVLSEKGRGATFSIYLPAIAESAVRETPPGASSSQTGSETVLIVDDEQIILDVTQMMLKSLGYQVLAASSGKEALEIFQGKSDRIALVILDMIMPGMGGAETFDGLKTVDPGVRVLLCSGYSIEGQAEQIIARGCKGFIQKPFDLVQLSQKIREALELPSR